MSLKHYEVYRRWIQEREPEMTENLIATHQDHLTDGSALSERPEDVERFHEIAREMGVPIKTRAPKRPKPEEMAKRYPAAGVFDWKTPELAQAVQDGGFMANVAKAELQRRTENRIAKVEGRSPTPPSEEAKTPPVEIAKRDFDEQKVKRDAHGRFSRTEEAKRPKAKTPDKQTREQRLIKRVEEGWGDNLKPGAATTARMQLQTIEEHGWQIKEVVRQPLVSGADSERRATLFIEKDGDTISFGMNPRGDVSNLQFGDVMWRRNLLVDRSYKDEHTSQIDNVLNAIDNDIIVGPGNNHFIGEETGKDGIVIYRDLNIDGAVKFFATNDDEFREMLDVAWTGEDFLADIEPNGRGQSGPLKSRLYDMLESDYFTLDEMALGKPRDLSHSSSHTQLFLHMTEAIGVDGTGEDLVNTVNELNIYSQGKNFVLETAEEVGKVYDNFIAPNSEVKMSDEQEEFVRNLLDEYEPGKEKTHYLDGQPFQIRRGRPDATGPSVDGRIEVEKMRVTVMLDDVTDAQDVIDYVNERARQTRRSTLLREASEHYGTGRAADHGVRHLDSLIEDLEERIEYVETVPTDDTAYMAEISNRLYDKSFDVQKESRRTVSNVIRHFELSGRWDGLDNHWESRVHERDLLGEKSQRLEALSDSFKMASVYFGAQNSDGMDVVGASGHMTGRVEKEMRRHLETSQDVGIESHEYLELLIKHDYQPDHVWNNAVEGNYRFVTEAVGAVAAEREAVIVNEISSLEFHDEDVVDALINHGEGRSRDEHPLIHRSDSHFGLEGKSAFNSSTLRTRFKARIQQQLTDGILARDEGQVAEVIDGLEEEYVASARREMQYRFDDPVKRMGDVRDIVTEEHVEEIFGDALSMEEFVGLGERWDRDADWKLIHDVREAYFDSRLMSEDDERIGDPDTFIGQVSEIDFNDDWVSRARVVADRETEKIAIDIKVRNEFTVPDINEDNETAITNQQDKEEFFEMMSDPRRAAVARFAREQTDAWAESASDHKVPSLTIQAVAGLKWGNMETLPFHMAREISGSSDIGYEVTDRIEEYGALIDATLDAMYENTQRQFAEQGIEEVVIYRGMRLDNHDPPEWATGSAHRKRPAANRIVGSKDGEGFVFGADINMNPLSSWSTDWTEAERFSSTSGGGIMLAARFPVSEVVGTARTGFGCLSEHEFVMRGGWDKDIEAGLRWLS